MQSEHSEVHTSATHHRGASRRAVVTTAAWSAPVIAAAIASPLAAASTTGKVEFLRLTGYTFVDKFFNSALDTRYEVFPGLGFEIVNNTSATVPAGTITATVSVDADLFRLSEGDEVPVNIQETQSYFSGTASVANGVATASFTIPVDVTPGVSYTVFINLPFYNSAPDDIYDQYTPSVITVTHQGESTTIAAFEAEAFPSTPWWVDYTVNFSELTTIVAGDCTTAVPPRGTVASKGPNPSPADYQVLLRVDPALISDVQTTALLDGAAFAGGFVRDATDSSLWIFDIGQQLASGQTLTFDLAYTAVDGATSATIVPSSSAGVPAEYDAANFTYALAPDQRVGLAGFYGSAPVCTP